MNQQPPKHNNRSVERLLIEASHTLNSDLELEPLIKNILNILADFLNAETSLIILFDPFSNSSELYSFNAENMLIRKDYDMQDSSDITSLVTENKKPILVNRKNCGKEIENAVKQKLNMPCLNLMASPILQKDKFLGVIEVYNKKGQWDFTEKDLEIMTALSDQIALAVSNARLICRVRRKSSEAQSLYEVGKLMSGTLKLEELLELIVDQVSHLVKVDVATIYVVDPEDGSIKDIVSKGVPKKYHENLNIKIGQGICGWVAKTGQSVVLNDVSENKQYISMRPQTKSEIAVPLLSREKVIGVFNVESDDLNAYTQADVELLETFASQAAISIERAMLYQQSIEQKSLEEKLAIARRIQQTFLPEKAPDISGFDIAGMNMPSEVVGGDYYDFIDIVKNQYGIAIGDVSGKGIGAALIMAAFRASLKAEIRNNYAIRTIFAKVNSLLCESIESGNYVTSVYGVLDAKNLVFTFSNAGHNPPLLFKTDGRIIDLIEGGLALGMFPGSEYEERPVNIQHGDILLFYTDGITEAQNKSDEEFGLTRLQQLIQNSKELSSEEIIKRVIDTVQEFKDPSIHLDDLTLILVKCLEPSMKQQY